MGGERRTGRGGGTARHREAVCPAPCPLLPVSRPSGHPGGTGGIRRPPRAGQQGRSAGPHGRGPCPAPTPLTPPHASRPNCRKPAEDPQSKTWGLRLSADRSAPLLPLPHGGRGRVARTHAPLPSPRRGLALWGAHPTASVSVQPRPWHRLGPGKGRWLPGPSQPRPVPAPLLPQLLSLGAPLMPQACGFTLTGVGPSPHLAAGRRVIPNGPANPRSERLGAPSCLRTYVHACVHVSTRVRGIHVGVGAVCCVSGKRESRPSEDMAEGSLQAPHPEQRPRAPRTCPSPGGGCLPLQVLLRPLPCPALPSVLPTLPRMGRSWDAGLKHRFGGPKPGPNPGWGLEVLQANSPRGLPTKPCTDWTPHCPPSLSPWRGCVTLRLLQELVPGEMRQSRGTPAAHGAQAPVGSCPAPARPCPRQPGLPTVSQRSPLCASCGPKSPPHCRPPGRSPHRPPPGTTGSAFWVGKPGLPVSLPVLV